MLVWSKNSVRHGRLPLGWDKTRGRVLSRDRFECQLAYPGCRSIASDVDHIVAGDDNRLGNLQSVCFKCHRTKSSREGNKRMRQIRSRRSRPSERHPGSLS